MFLTEEKDKMVAQYLTVPEAAHLLQLHPETVKELLRAHQLPGRKLGRQWRIHREALDRYMRGESLEDLSS